MPRPKKWTEALCLEAIRSYEASTDTPSEPGYENWQKRVKGMPSGPTIIRTFGSWNAARRLAAEDPETVVLNKPNWELRWSEEACLDAIRRYEQAAKEAGKNATSDGYALWQTYHNDAPSEYRQYGTWNEMRLRASNGIEDIKIDKRGRHPKSRSH